MLGVVVAQAPRRFRARRRIRGAGAGGRRAVRPVRLRQDHARQHRRGPAGAGRRPHRDRRRGAVRHGAPACRVPARAAPHRLRVPGRAPVSAPERARAISSTGAGAAAPRTAASASTTSSTCSASARCCRAGLTRCPAASGSASRSAARCWRSRGCCCSTSRSPRSTPRAARRCCPISSGVRDHFAHSDDLREPPVRGGRAGRDSRRRAGGAAGSRRRGH